MRTMEVPMTPHTARRNWALPTVAAMFLAVTAIQGVAHGEIKQTQLDAAVAGIGSSQFKGAGSADRISVVLIPEVHRVALVQLEEALILQRLNTEAGISALILEGLLPDAAGKLSRPTGFDASQGVVLMRDGTITAAEFMYLYKGIKLIPGETHATHDPYATPTEICGLLGSYSALVLRQRKDPRSNAAVREFSKAMRRMNVTVEELNKITGSDGNSCSTMEKVEQLDRDTISSTKAVAVLVPEVEAYVHDFCEPQDASTFTQIDRELQTLTSLRTVLAQQLPPSQLSQIDEYENYVKARDQASLIMVQSLITEVTQHPDGIVVAILGAAHLNRMVDKLNQAGLQVAVVDLEAMDKLSNGNLRIV